MSEQDGPGGESTFSSSREARERAEMRRERFHELVTKVVDELPPEFAEKMDNVDVVVEDWPSVTQLARVGARNRFGLLGLYEGVPKTGRSSSYGMVLPDKITIFRKPIEAQCRSWAQVDDRIRSTVWHEIAHHFGMDERTIRSIEAERQRKPR